MEKDNKDKDFENFNDKDIASEETEASDKINEKGENQEETKSSNKKPSKKSKKSKSNELENLKQELGELKDKYVRLSAEFDNYRKRTLKERIELSKTAGENMLIQILPVFDDLNRASEHVKEAKTMDGLKEGLDLIFNKFNDFMKQQGIREIEAKGLEFDTDKHEAVTKFPAPDESQKGKVIDVVQKGYTLNDKVIRYAKVVVGE
jgi:molecular chaperone GrpE